MIPSILWQTAKTADDLNSRFVKSWTVKCPTLDIRFMDDNACENFIRDNFSDEVFFVYKSLPLGIMRADMWRIAVIYINGGVYSDTDVFCKNDISEILNSDVVFCQEHIGSNDVSNYFFAASPRHPMLKRVLDIMVSSFHDTFNTNTDLLVQNFGMHSLQIAIDEYKVELVDRTTINHYMNHACHGTWRESEINYKRSSDMKPITFFTTFNKSGYLLYGKTWINTFIKNVAPKSPNIKAKIYTHGFKIAINHPQIEMLDFDNELSDHTKWKNEFSEKSTYSKYVHDMSIRFSHKGFVIQHALDNISDGYAIWLDGDCVMHDYSYDDFPKNILNNLVVAAQVEHAGTHHHVESGVLVFDMEHKDIQLFKDAFKKNYTVDEALTMPEPYDGFIVYKSIISSGIEFNNLNEKFGIGGIQSDPSLTFLHPEIKNRFTHNIGVTGKSQYQNWDSVKRTDNVFSLIAGIVNNMSETELKIHEMKKKRALATLNRTQS